MGKIPPAHLLGVRKRLHKINENIALEEWERAEALLTTLLEKNKGGANAVLAHVRVLRGKGEAEKALMVAIEESHKYPEELLFRLEEGKILHSLGRSKEALLAFQVCEPILHNENDCYHYAAALFNDGHYPACLKIIEPFIPYHFVRASFFCLEAMR